MKDEDFDTAPLLSDPESGAHRSPRDHHGRFSLASCRFPTRRIHLILLGVALFVLGYLAHPQTAGAGQTIRYWTSPRFQRAVRIRVFNELLQERYPSSDEGSRNHRQHNFDSLERLALCTNAGTCTENEKTIIVLASAHFGNALAGMVSGEDIWAISTLHAFQELNMTTLITFGHMETLFIYQSLPDLIPVVIWEGGNLRRCIARNSTNHIEMEQKDEESGAWQHGIQGCIQTPHFPLGVPIWKSFAFHFWDNAASPLGREWTLAPEDYGAMDRDHEGNHYLGYSIEQRCLNAPYFSEREHRAIVLAKNPSYFEKIRNRFYHLLNGAKERVPDAADPAGVMTQFKIISTAGHEVTPNNPAAEIDEPGVEVIGRQPQDQWIQTVARSKVMLGIGAPPLSPSPFDALCCGVPFINPILKWDQSDPTNRFKWVTQANGLKFVDPPYVYHVFQEDADGLAKALGDAVANPITRYVPPNMRSDAVRDRHLDLVKGDWLAAAKKYVGEHFDANDPDTTWLCMDPPKNRNTFMMPGHEGEAGAA